MEWTTNCTTVPVAKSNIIQQAWNALSLCLPHCLTFSRLKSPKALNFDGKIWTMSYGSTNFAPTLTHQHPMHCFIRESNRNLQQTSNGAVFSELLALVWVVEGSDHHHPFLINLVFFQKSHIPKASHKCSE
jgi:hypothetical protein